MRTLRVHDERGIALPVAVFALVVIGALVAGTFFIGRLEQQTGSNMLYVTQAAGAADAGLTKAVEQDPSVFTGTSVWAPAAPVDLQLATALVGSNSRLDYTTSIRRLNNSLFLVTSTGRRLGSGDQALATQQFGMLYRIVKPTIGVNSAITVTQPIQLNGNSFEVSGINSNPPGWTDCPGVSPDNTDDKVGIRSSTSTGMSGQDLDNIFGYPEKAVANDPTITSATFRDFVDATFASMSTQPGAKQLPLTTPYNGVGPVLDTGPNPDVCDKNAPLNFGEPARPGTVPECYNYLPVVNGTGAQTKFAAGSRGQGTLLINGDLEITGGFEWTGVIIVRGSFKITGTGNKITGAVLAESVTDDNSIGGNVTINYSACAVDKALKGAALPSPVGQRSWTQLY